MSDSVERETLISAFVSDFTKAQNAAGLTPAFLATALKRLINAKKTDTFKGEKITKKTLLGPDLEPFKDQTGNTFVEEIREDVVIYSKPMTDNATRRQALQMALNIRGIQTTSPQTSLNINNPGEVNFMGAVAKILGSNGDSVDD